MVSDNRTVFLDTNTLLHYPLIKDVDWKVVAGCETVHLVICMQVIHELDEKKSDARLGDRANRVIKEIKSILQASGRVRDGITLEVFNYEVRGDDFPPTMSFDSKDDRIVRSLKKYAELHSVAEPAIYSEDIGMALRCMAHGIAVIEPDAQIRLPTPQSEQDKKYKQLLAENDQLKNRVPALEVIVGPARAKSPETAPVEFKVTGVGPGWEVDEALEAYRREKKLFPIGNKTSDFDNPLASALYDSVISSADARYNVQLSEHLKEYKEWLEHKRFIEAIGALRFDMAIWLANTGKAPADDVDVLIEVGEPVVWLYEESSDDAKFLTVGKPPEPPDPPSYALFTIPTFSGMAPKLSTIAAMRDMWNRNARVVHDEAANTFKVSYSTKRLKHNDHDLMGTLIVVVGGEIRPFQMSYRITTSNLANPVEGTVNVIVRDVGENA